MSSALEPFQRPASARKNRYLHAVTASSTRLVWAFIFLEAAWMVLTWAHLPACEAARAWLTASRRAWMLQEL